MGFLTDYEGDQVIYHGKVYDLDLSYDSVLNVQRLCKDRTIVSPFICLDAAMKILVGKPAMSLTFPEKQELLEQIFQEKIALKPKPKVGKQIKTVDFELDGEYIFASFWQDYGIDLLEEQGRLHWKKFVALFDGLSDKTKIRNIMRIRAADIPEMTAHNQKEVQNLIELKSYYALPVEGGGGQKGLDALFSALETQAVRM